MGRALELFGKKKPGSFNINTFQLALCAVQGPVLPSTSHVPVDFGREISNSKLTSDCSYRNTTNAVQLSENSTHACSRSLYVPCPWINTSIFRCSPLPDLMSFPLGPDKNYSRYPCWSEANTRSRKSHLQTDPEIAPPRLIT